MGNGNSSSGGTGSALGAVAVIILLVYLLGSCTGGGSSSDSSVGREKRCWYCAKVIVNSAGVPIHKTNGKCDYCGHLNW